MNRIRLKKQLLVDEGLKLKPYRCSAGKLSIGCGRNLDDKGILESEAMILLDNDIDEAERSCRRYLKFWDSLSDSRQEALVNMAFNLGIDGLLKFKNTLALISSGNYAAAAHEMLDSKWATQVGDRAKRLSEMMENG